MLRAFACIPQPQVLPANRKSISSHGILSHKLQEVCMHAARPVGVGEGRLRAHRRRARGRRADGACHLLFVDDMHAATGGILAHGIGLRARGVHAVFRRSSSTPERHDMHAKTPRKSFAQIPRRVRWSSVGADVGAAAPFASSRCARILPSGHDGTDDGFAPPAGTALDIRLVLRASRLRTAATSERGPSHVAVRTSWRRANVTEPAAALAAALSSKHGAVHNVSEQDHQLGRQNLRHKVLLEERPRPQQRHLPHQLRRQGRELLPHEAVHRQDRWRLHQRRLGRVDT